MSTIAGADQTRTRKLICATLVICGFFELVLALLFATVWAMPWFYHGSIGASVLAAFLAFSLPSQFGADGFL